MKKFWITLLLCISAFAQSEMSLGFQNATAGGAIVGTAALNGAASGGFSAAWLGLGFISSHTATLNNVWLYVFSVTGSLGASDLVCDIYSDNGGIPNASLGSTSTVAATPTVASWVEFTGLSVSLTAGTQYWLVMRNANATPTANYPTWQFGGTNSANMFSGGNASQQMGFYKLGSVNSGSTWATAPLYNVGGWRLDYAGPVYEGLPFQSSSAVSTTKLFGTQQAAVVFTLTNVSINNTGAAILARKVGSPPNPLVVTLYNNSTPLASATVPVANILSATVGVINVRWPVVKLSAGTKLRLSLSTSAGDASNYYQFGVEQILQNSAQSRGLLPFGGFMESLCASTCTTAGNWTDSSTIFLAGMALILPPGDEFASGGGGQNGYPIIR